MKATQIRITLGLVAAVLGLGAHAASADLVSPEGAFTAALCPSSTVTIKMGTSTLTCKTSETSGSLFSSPSGQPVCTELAAPTLTQCTLSSSGFTIPVTCTTSGIWDWCTTSLFTSTLVAGAIQCTSSILGQTCSEISGSVTISGTWSNASSSVSFTNQTVPVTTKGGFPCPSSVSMSMSFCWATSPSFTIFPN